MFRAPRCVLVYAGFGVWGWRGTARGGAMGPANFSSTNISPSFNSSSKKDPGTYKGPRQNANPSGFWDEHITHITLSKCTEAA